MLDLTNTSFESAAQAVDSAMTINARSGAYVVAALRAGLCQHAEIGDWRDFPAGKLESFCNLLVHRAVHGRDGAVEFDRQSVANIFAQALPAALKGTTSEGMRFRGGLDDVADPSKKGAKDSIWTKRETRFLSKGAKNKDLYRVAWLSAIEPTTKKTDPLDAMPTHSGLLGSFDVSQVETDALLPSGYIRRPAPVGEYDLGAELETYCLDRDRADVVGTRPTDKPRFGVYDRLVEKNRALKEALDLALERAEHAERALAEAKAKRPSRAKA